MTQRTGRLSRRAFARQLPVLGAAGFALACAAPADTRDVSASAGDTPPAPTATQGGGGQGVHVIDHVSPRRDFVGGQPGRFAWSAAPGADRYAIGVWNEVDRLIWRQDDVSGTSIDRPAGFDLEPGTYFWSVTGLQQGREIARSGLAAFVVE